MRLLDLFCGAGGAAMGYHRAGFDEIVGVDIKPQPRYPFRFRQDDALKVMDELLRYGYLPVEDGPATTWYRLKDFDAIHASPPCQAYSALKTMRNLREGHPELVGAVRDRLAASGVPWIIENVFGAPLITPLILCGSQFMLRSEAGYELRRHRYFETSFAMLAPGPCRHGAMTAGVYGEKVRDIAKEKRHYSQPSQARGAPVGVVLPQRIGHEIMGIDWMKIGELSEAIPPAYTEYIGRQLLEHIGLTEG